MTPPVRHEPRVLPMALWVPKLGCCAILRWNCGHGPAVPLPELPCPQRPLQEANCVATIGFHRNTSLLQGAFGIADVDSQLVIRLCTLTITLTHVSTHSHAHERTHATKDATPCHAWNPGAGRPIPCHRKPPPARLLPPTHQTARLPPPEPRPPARAPSAGRRADRAASALGLGPGGARPLPRALLPLVGAPAWAPDSRAPRLRVPGGCSRAPPSVARRQAMRGPAEAGTRWRPALNSRAIWSKLNRHLDAGRAPTRPAQPMSG